jgi:hypothetical protein
MFWLRLGCGPDEPFAVGADVPLADMIPIGDRDFLLLAIGALHP